MPRKIVITNQKGGVGKTTTSVNLSVSLAEKGQNTLLIDLDPQANASKRLGAQDQANNISTALLKPREIAAQDVVYEALAGDVVIKNLYILPTSADRELAATQEILATKNKREEILKRFLNKNETYFDNFDFIVIDTNPSLSVLTVNAITASDELIIPVSTSADSYESAIQVIETAMELNDAEESSEIKYRILRCMIDKRSRTVAQLTERLAATHMGQVFDTHISQNVEFEKSEALRKPVFSIYPNGKAHQEYSAVAQEIIKDE